MASEKRNNRMKGVVATIMFHMLILAAFLFFGLSTPLPLPGEEGVEVNLGNSDEGSGFIQQEQAGSALQPGPETETDEEDIKPPDEEIVEAVEEHLKEVTEDSVEEPEEDPQIEETIETQETEESINAGDEPADVKPEAEPVEKPEEEPEQQPEQQPEVNPAENQAEQIVEQPKVNPRALYKGKSGSGETGSNEGETGDPGDQGRETGDPLVPDHDGLGGRGNGISYSLGDRGALALSEPPYDSPEQGKVVVTIWVNQAGQVVKAVTGAKGTNIADARLRQLARDAALRSTFQPDPEAPDLQKGSITYNFLRIN